MGSGCVFRCACGGRGVKGDSVVLSEIWGLAAEVGPSCLWKQMGSPVSQLLFKTDVRVLYK